MQNPAVSVLLYVQWRTLAVGGGGGGGGLLKA